MTTPLLRLSAPLTGPLVERLSRERQALRVRAFGGSALAVAATTALVCAAGAWLLADSRWLQLPRAVPVLIWMIAAALAVTTAQIFRRRDRELETLSSLALAVEHEQGLRAGSLRGALEVSEHGLLGARAASDIVGRLSPNGALVPRVRASLVQRLLLAGACGVVAVALVVVASRSARDGFAAVVHPIGAWRGLLLPALGFPGVPNNVPRGMPLTVYVAASGRATVTVSRRAAGEAWRDTTITVDQVTGRAVLDLGPVRAPLTLRAADGRSPEAVANIAVGERGWVGDVALRAEYPAYLARAAEAIDAVPPVRVPRGTVLQVMAALHGGARHALLTNGKDTVRFTVEGDSAVIRARIVANQDESWQWIASATPRADGATLPPELPDALALSVAPDLKPRIAIVAPQSDTAIGTSGVVPLVIDALDDHGLASVSVQLWRETGSGTGASASGRMEKLGVAEPMSPEWQGAAGLTLAGRGLEAGDRLHIVAVAIDNSPWHQEGQSAELILRVPSLSEQRTIARSLADSLASRAQQMASAEKRLQQSTSEASKARDPKNGGRGTDAPTSQSEPKGKDGTMSFAAAEKARQVARDQRQLSAKVDSLRASAKELEQRLKDAGALDTALANRMRDVQRMLREAMTPEMQKQLADLEKATDRLSGTEAQQSMEQLAAQQQAMREQLDKSAEMLKRAALEGAMQTLRDEASDLAKAEQLLADKMEGKKPAEPKGGDAKSGSVKAGDKGATDSDPRSLSDRSRALQQEVDRLAKRLEDAGAKPGATRTRAAQPMVQQAAEAMARAAQQANKGGNDAKATDADKKQADANLNGADDKTRSAQLDSVQRAQQDALNKALEALTGEKQDTKPKGQEQQKKPGELEKLTQPPQQGPGGSDGKASFSPDKDAKNGHAGDSKAGGQQQSGQQGAQPQSGAGDTRRAGEAMDRAAKQLSDARDAQVGAWKEELTQQLDQSINETSQLARQQQALEDRAKKDGMSQSMQGEQGALQQGVKQAAERMEKAGRSSSLLSQRSQKAMAEAQKRSEQATQALGQSQVPGGPESAQSAMKDASEALNQALSSLVRDRERVNNANSASGFSEMMEQLKQLAQQQGSLNGQMQGLSMLPGGSQGNQARQQARALARQQRDVAHSLQDVSDADVSGRTDALAKEAQQLAQAMERSGPDPSVAARQAQLYRRLLDAGRFLEQDERDDQGPREAKAATGTGAHAPADGQQSGRAANKFALPTWNDLRGLGAEDRRLVLEYFRRLNVTP